jgi:hypothetical protein
MKASDKNISSSKSNGEFPEKKDILEGKKKLLEVYLLISALVIATTQTTTFLIAINTSINETLYHQSKLYTKGVIGSSNLAFFLLLFLLIVYYCDFFDNSLLYTFLFVYSLPILFSS